MTTHVVHLANPDGPSLLRELSHRISNELTCAVSTISARAMQSDDVAVKAALLDVVGVLHRYADVNRALHIPDQGDLTDAARYIQRLCYVLLREWRQPAHR